MLALGGVVVARSLRGERRIAADDFFTGLYTTALAPDEVIVACEIRVTQTNQQVSFSELARRHGDYAVVGLAASARLDDNKLSDIRLAWIGVGSTPMRSVQTEQALGGRYLTVQAVSQAVDMLRSELSPIADLTHSEAAKRQLAGVLLKRALLSWMPTSTAPATALTQKETA